MRPDQLRQRQLPEFERRLREASGAGAKAAHRDARPCAAAACGARGRRRKMLLLQRPKLLRIVVGGDRFNSVTRLKTT